MTKVTFDTSDRIEAAALDLIDELVAKACYSEPQKCAIAKALMRSAGNALATLSSHDDAFLEHTKHARHHQARMGQRQPGARR